MAAVSNAPFRLIARECGSAMTTTEEIDATSLVRGSPRALDIIDCYPEERPIAMQLLGCDAGILVDAAQQLVAAGADVIDLNMGCPMPKITKQGKGAALMRDLDATEALLRAMRAAIRVPFTIKIRGGWDDEHLNAVEVAQLAEDEGVDAITVHPRTRSQRFTGKAPWEIIGDVVRAVRIPVTGNGDVTSMVEARRMMAETGCADVMIGRGAMGRPWVFDESYENLPAAEQWDYRGRVIRRHCQLIMERSDARHWVTQLRKHLAWYTEGTYEAAATRDRLFRAKSQDDVMAVFEEHWERAREPFLSMAHYRNARPALAGVEG
ncbi:MAG: tRNA dihydrouridine synthase DusB [Anaerolinea sp.]|nr:tRNA dihydrouridine synthase DusB [Anaerolinea sp.]